MRLIAILLALLFAGSPVSFAGESLERLFSNEGIAGSITIYNPEADEWIYSDQADALVGSIPASTFKILHSLIALEEKVLTPYEILKWDGEDKTFKGKAVSSWNADTNLEEAFRNSVIWFYVEISKRISREVYGKYLVEIGYGNLDLSEEGPDFWNYGSMEISPQNQVVFLTKLCQMELPFQRENVDLVKKYMKISQDGDYCLYGKSGWGCKNGKDIGWLVGFLETRNAKYIYATRIVADSAALPGEFGKYRSEITLKAFRELGIIN